MTHISHILKCGKSKGGRQSSVDSSLNRCLLRTCFRPRFYGFTLTYLMSKVVHMVYEPGCGSGTAEDGLML